MNDKRRTSFVFMRDWIPIFNLLDDKSQVDELLRAINSLLDDEEPVINDSKVQAAWAFIGPKLQANIEHYDEVSRNRAAAGKKGGLASAKQRQANAKQTESNSEANIKQIQHDTDTDTDTDTVSDTVTDTQLLKEKDNSNELSKEKAELSLLPTNAIEEPKKNKRFVKPTREEVEAYIFTHGLGVDAGKFMDHYEANGWKVGRNPMKSWQAALSYWDRTDSERKTQKKSESFLNL